MKWFDNWFAKKCKQAWENADAREESPVGLNIPTAKASRRRNTLVAGGDNELRTDPITFKMFKANGGWAVEFHQYDHKADKMDTSLYVVGSEDELGNSISKIITMEALKR